MSEIAPIFSDRINDTERPYDTVQNRIQTLYDEDWFTPNAFYPTVLGYFKSTGKPEDAAAKQRNITEFFAKMNPSFTKSGGVLKTAIPHDYIKKYENCIKEEANLGIDKRFAPYLKYILSVSGLKLPTAPFKKKDGRLTAETINSGNEFITIKFSNPRNLDLIYKLQEWQQLWFLYTQERRVVQAKWDQTGDRGRPNDTYKAYAYDDKGNIEEKGNTPLGDSGEGYFGMDYVKIFPNGKMESIGHLCIAGLIPQNVNISQGNWGPGESPNSSVPTLDVKFIYSQAILALKSDEFTIEGTTNEVLGEKEGHTVKYIYFQ